MRKKRAHDAASPLDGQRHTHDLDTRILRGAGWVTLSRGSQAFVSTLSLLVLARLLEPKAFGLVALAGTLLLIVQVVQGSGLGAALIYRRHGIEEAAGSVLVYSTLAGAALFALTVGTSRFIADAFGQPEATDVIRALAIILFIRGLGVAPTAILERDLNFRARMVGEVTGSLFQGVVAISLAFAGFGVWSLVLGNIVSTSVQTSVSWYYAPVHPSPSHARWSILRELLGYGRFVTAGNLITLATRNLDNLVVARVLGPAALGVYALAFRLATLPSGVFAGVVGRVMLPAYALLQDDPAAFRRAFVHNLQRIALLALPVSVLLIVGADPIITALLGDKWLGAIEPLRLLALYGLVVSFTSPCGPVYQAAGKPQLVPLLAVPMLVVMIPCLIVLTPSLGAAGAALAMLVARLTAAVPALAVAMRILSLGAGDLARSLVPSFICCGILAAALAALLQPTGGLPPLIRLTTFVVAALIVYAASVAVFARETLSYVWVSLKGRRVAEAGA